MSIVISALAILVGLIAVYLASESKQNIEAKIKQFGEAQSRAAKNATEEIRSSLDSVYDRLDALENSSNDLTEFKPKFDAEISEINKKLAEINSKMGSLKSLRENEGGAKGFEAFGSENKTE